MFNIDRISDISCCHGDHYHYKDTAMHYNDITDVENSDNISGSDNDVASGSDDDVSTDSHDELHKVHHLVRTLMMLPSCRYCLDRR